MFNLHVPSLRIERRTLHTMMAIAAVVLLAALFPDLAHASSGAADDQENLPFIGVMDKLSQALTGPFAFAISVIGIVIAGAILIFGGDMNGFVRSLVFLVLVIAIIMGSGSLIEYISGKSATIASVGQPLVLGIQTQLG